MPAIIDARRLGGVLGVGRTRAAEEGHAEGLGEAGRGQASGEREHRRREDDREPPGPCKRPAPPSRAWKVIHSLTKPLSGGRRRDGHGPEQEQPRRPRHAPGEPAELLHVADVRSR